MIPSPDLIRKMADWRAKQAAGTMTIEDWKEATDSLRAHRTGSQTSAAARRAKSAPVNVEALKDSLRGLRKA